MVSYYKDGKIILCGKLSFLLDRILIFSNTSTRKYLLFRRFLILRNVFLILPQKKSTKTFAGIKTFHLAR